MGETFSGDVLFFNTFDGGDILIKNGLIEPDRSFSTAVYISLFGGNKEDPGTVKNNLGWWGNYMSNVPENEKLVSRFQHVITGLPLTVKNLLAAETAAALDLDWMKKEGIVDKIIVSGRASATTQADFTYLLEKNGEKIGSGEFGIQWEAGVYGV